MIEPLQITSREARSISLGSGAFPTEILAQFDREPDIRTNMPVMITAFGIKEVGYVDNYAVVRDRFLWGDRIVHGVRVSLGIRSNPFLEEK